MRITTTKNLHEDNDCDQSTLPSWKQESRSGQDQKANDHGRAKKQESSTRASMRAGIPRSSLEFGPNAKVSVARVLGARVVLGDVKSIAGEAGPFRLGQLAEAVDGRFAGRHAMRGSSGLLDPQYSVRHRSPWSATVMEIQQITARQPG
jgi:hypothetical protein